MAKVIYEFDLNDPDDQYRREIYRDAEPLYSGAANFAEALRSTIKYSELTDQESTIMEAVRKAFWECMKEAGVRVDLVGGSAPASIKWEKKS